MVEIRKGLATFGQRSNVEAKYLPVIIDYLEAKPITVRVAVAEAELQKSEDVDLIWTVSNEDGWDEDRYVEIKFDTQGHATGNFAFETVSNELRTTRGCFLRTTASLFYYYFVETAELYIFETDVIRRYFEEEVSSRPNRYRLFETYTQLSGGKVYAAFGRLVPVKEVVRDLSGKFYYRDLKEIANRVVPGSYS